MIDRPPHVAIVGCTGAVGREFLNILAERDLPMASLTLLASPRSAGRVIEHDGSPIEVKALAESSFDGVDIALFSAGGEISRQFAPFAVESGATVIDNSSAFRMDPGVPLIVPEINGDVLDEFRGRGPGIIANPNCSTIIALMAIAPLHRAAPCGIQRMVISTYQAASGGGAAMMAELEQQARDHAAGRPLRHDILGRPYLFNLFSHNTAIDPATGYNTEELKLIRETHKILDDATIAITATCVRVPVLRAHSEAINLTFREPGTMSEAQARQVLAAATGIRIVDDRAANRFPEPIDASGQDEVLVGRIRADISQPPGKGLDLFVSGDQLRKGAALNAIQIAERLVTGARMFTA
jgi:aspartate-semialdehyde dehydrogenase